ncbi:adhesion G-protein coupled receptor D1-like [Dendronephthya gigantea]|uniref:adhesion G-protein coupled receptor D1-like n=1 Tax=Dendronephthya gigantea TaxID=151771 RepID=UPI00106B37A8|nr:adhesion G-protein coupled receptor D1-like [Dendronephthya gigantea]
MSVDKCDIVAVLLIISLLQITVSFTGVKGNHKGNSKGGQCVRHDRFNNANKTMINPEKNELKRFRLLCSAPPFELAFEVRYTNGKLCSCGRYEAIKGRFVQCTKKLTLNFTTYIFAEKELKRTWRCHFKFYEQGNEYFSQVELTIGQKNVPNEPSSIAGMPAHPTWLTKANFTTRLSTSVIGHLCGGSSQITSQNVLGNSATYSSQISLFPSITFTSEISSSMPKSSTPTIEPTPLDSSVVTISLSISPVLLITPSMKDIQRSSFIRVTPSKTNVFSTSILSPDEEEKKKLKEDIEFVNNLNTSNVNINDEKTIKRVLDAAANLINTNLTAEDQNEDPGMQAVKVLEDLGKSISRQLALPKNESSVTFQKVTDDLVFGVALVNATTTPDFSFPSDESKATGSEKINIPSSVFVSDSGKAYFVGIIFKAYREMRNKTGNFTMGTKVINAAVSPPLRKTLADPVEMTFKKNIISETVASDCSFWIENATHPGEHGGWSTKQCQRTFENRSHIQCQCYHFTNFAVLFKVSDNQDVSNEDTFRLVIITHIGLGLSILGCFLTFVVYVTLSNVKTDRAVIHTNLVLALGIADVIFLVTVIVKPVGDSCLALAMLAFFFYLAVFFWMLDEGVYIYLMVIKVFRGNDAMRRRMAYLVGWVCPTIIAIITWVLLRDEVVSKYHCWLSVKSGAIWAFVGPGLLIILINFIILVVVMRTTWVRFGDDKEYGRLKSATKTFGAVIPILGITWIFGVMAFNESSIVFQYLFAITNSLQGALIFILYCLVNKEVRNELRRKLTVWQTRREFSSSSANTRRTYVISSEKNTTFNLTTASMQATPDLYRRPMEVIEGVPPQGKVDLGYTSEDDNKTKEKEFELGGEEWSGGKKGKS